MSKSTKFYEIILKLYPDIINQQIQIAGITGNYLSNLFIYDLKYMDFIMHEKIGKEKKEINELYKFSE